MPHRGDQVKNLFIVANDDAGAELLFYLGSPLAGFFPQLKKVPVLYELMSPAVENFGAANFSDFSLDRFLLLPGRTLVYRQDATRDIYRDISHRTVTIESIRQWCRFSRTRNRQVV